MPSALTRTSVLSTKTPAAPIQCVRIHSEASIAHVFRAMLLPIARLATPEPCPILVFPFVSTAAGRVDAPHPVFALATLVGLAKTARLTAGAIFMLPALTTRRLAYVPIAKKTPLAHSVPNVCLVSGAIPQMGRHASPAIATDTAMPVRASVIQQLAPVSATPQPPARTVNRAMSTTTVRRSMVAPASLAASFLPALWVPTRPGPIAWFYRHQLARSVLLASQTSVARKPSTTRRASG